MSKQEVLETLTFIFCTTQLLNFSLHASSSNSILHHKSCMKPLKTCQTGTIFTYDTIFCSASKMHHLLRNVGLEYREIAPSRFYTIYAFRHILGAISFDFLKLYGKAMEMLGYCNDVLQTAQKP